MHNVTGQFAEISQAQAGRATKLAALAMEGAEKLAKVNMEAAKSAIAQVVEGAQAITATKDVQQLFALNTKLAEASVQAALGYSKTVYELATAIQAQYTTLVEESMADYTKDAAAWIDQASKSAPAGSEAAISAFRQGFAATTAAFDQFNQASKQVASVANKNLSAASASVSKAVAATNGSKPA